MHWGYGMGWGAMICGGAALLLLVGLVVLVVLLLARSSSGSPRSTGSTESSSQTALDIAKERYARGEISREEYHEIRDNLTR